VAVATPTGLITPIVFGIDTLGLAAVAATVRDLGARARDGKLAPHEYQGGSFSVSNLGMFGVNQFSAVINPPQAAILAVGGGTPTLRPSGPAGDSSSGGVTTKSVMTARLSFDRRVVDEKAAAMFLQAFRHYMQSPELMLL
jgi:pyruvate dehydrogenase E2 component (dihydrolipoamide acetyltransferase)